MEKNTMEMSKTTYIPNIPTYSGGPSAPGFVEPQRPMGFEEPQRPPGFSEPQNPPGFNVSPHQPAYGNPPPYSETQPSQPPRPAPTVIPARTTVITTSPAIVMVNNLGPNPTSCFCSVCNKQVVTTVEKATTARTHLFAAFLCLFLCWCCVCVPYCVDSCKKTFHYCPQCKTYMGSSS